MSSLITNGSGMIDQTTITGALEHFYASFNQRDLIRMQQNWHQDESIRLCNPLGGIRCGWAEIQSMYERIFNGSARVFVEYYDIQILQTADSFISIGRERGYFERDGKRIDLAIRTSRCFQRFDGLWRQVHHHGSIDNPELLATYQQAVV
jgi:ketosteroid isomerase-like protein